MKWLALAAVALPVVGVIWLSALLVSETFEAYSTREAAIRALRDPRTTPLEPFGSLIRLWLRVL